MNRETLVSLLLAGVLQERDNKECYYRQKGAAWYHAESFISVLFLKKACRSSLTLLGEKRAAVINLQLEEVRTKKDAFDCYCIKCLTCKCTDGRSVAPLLFFTYSAVIIMTNKTMWLFLMTDHTFLWPLCVTWLYYMLGIFMNSYIKLTTNQK